MKGAMVVGVISECAHACFVSFTHFRRFLSHHSGAERHSCGSVAAFVCHSLSLSSILSLSLSFTLVYLFYLFLSQAPQIVIFFHGHIHWRYSSGSRHRYHQRSSLRLDIGKFHYRLEKVIIFYFVLVIFFFHIYIYDTYMSFYLFIYSEQIIYLQNNKGTKFID